MSRDTEDVLERRYHDLYAAHHAELLERRRTDPNFTVDDVRRFLKDAYLRQDNDWMGHGVLFHVTQGAIIAAYEAILAEWEAELQRERDRNQ
ncbi:MAG: hypothetical protein ACP5HG_07045 [Anaerolineae bacterium]